MIKRVLSLLLALVMVFSILPLSALAEGDEEPAEVVEEVEEPAPEPSEEPDPEPQPAQEPEPDPAEEEKEPLSVNETRDVIGSGTCGDNLTWTLTADGTLTISGTGDMINLEYYTYGYDWDYYNLSISQIILEPGVTSIGYYAFERFSNLTSISIPSTVTRIGGAAFKNCSSLTGVTIPEGVTAVAYDTFVGCTNLTSVALPSSIRTIGNGAFSGCTLLSDISIPSGLTYLGSSSFENCSSLTTVTIPGSTADILEKTFYGCSSLTTAVIGEGVNTIGNTAFYGCSSLTGITIPASVTEMGSGVFYGCSGLTSADIQADIYNIGENTFYNCQSLVSVTISQSVAVIEKNAFYGCSSLNNITLPVALAILGERVFSGCSSLTSIDIPIIIRSIEPYTFYNCRNLVSVTLPEELTSIGESAFEGCNKLTGVTIPNYVESIGASAFSGCWAIKSINIPDGITVINSSTFSACTSLTNVTIPDSVTEIRSYAFSNCTSLSSIALPENITNIDSGAFKSCSNLKSFTIPEGVTSLSEEIFASSGLQSITIPAHVQSIEGNAFYRCSSLSSVTIEPGVESIGAWAFGTCVSLTSVTLPNTVTRIDSNVFRECSKLERIKLSSGLTTISELAFANCAKLASVTIPDGVTTIETSAFANCTALESVNFPDSLTSIGWSAFSSCDSLTKIIFPDSLTTIVNFAFYDCEGLKKVTIPASVTSIGNSAFDGCPLLKSITFMHTRTDTLQLGNEVFWLDQSPALSTNIHVPDPDSINSAITSYDWSGDCRKVTYKELSDDDEPDVPLSYEIINNEVYITEVKGELPEIFTIPDEIDGYPVAGINSAAFKDCTDIKRVIIPAYVTTLGNEAFRGCSNLLNAEFQGAKPEFGSNVFKDCDTNFAIWATGDDVSGWPFNKTVTLTLKNAAGKPELDKNGNIRTYVILDNQVDGYPCYRNPGHLVIYHSYSGESFKDYQKEVSATYSDAHFITSNSYFNYELADLSLCMAMATSATPINTAIDDSVYHSDRYIRTALETAGFTNDYYSYRYGDSRSEYDDEAYAIAWKELPDGTPLVAVGIRSNGYGGGWISNAHVATDSYPSNAYGFYNSAHDVVYGNTSRSNLGLIDYLAYNGIAASSAKIWVFGFSRGGAIANCIGKILNDDSDINNENIYVYTFATPRTVKKGAVGNCQGVYNIVQEMDIVPQVPLQGWGFTRYGTTFSLPSKSIEGRSYTSRLENMKATFRSLMGSFGSSQAYLSYEGQELIVDEVMELLYTAVPTSFAYRNNLQDAMMDVCRAAFVTGGDSSSALNDILLYLFESQDFNDKLIYFLQHYEDFDKSDRTEKLKQITDLINTIPSENVPGKALIKPLLSFFVRLGIKSAFSSESAYNESIENKTLLYIQDFINAAKTDKHIFETPALIQHWPEEYLSWLRSGIDSNTLYQRGYKRAYLECPVDVTVYASDGTIVAQVINEEIIVEDLTIFLDGAGGKEIIIPEDDTYRIEITSREDDAAMSYVLTSCDFEGSMESREIFADIPLAEEQVLSTEINSGDTVITTGNEVLTPDLTLNESAYLSAEITAISNGNGTAAGNSLYTPGDVGMVMAEPDDGYALLGWYEGETLVSRDTVYAFTVTGSRTLTAVFAPVPDGIALDKEYMAMAPEQEAALTVSGIADEWMPFVVWSAENADENSNLLILTVSDGTVTAAGAGTAYAVASVTASGTTYSARCRVDVVAGDGDHPIAADVATEVNGVSGVRLPVTKATTELFRTDYTRIQVIPELTENYKTAQSTVVPTPPPAEDAGVAVESAAFTTDEVSRLFSLRVVDDRTLEIIPTAYALENYASVKGSYSSPIAVTVDGQVFTTDALTLTVKKTEPSIKAGSVTLNSFFADTQTVSFTGGTVASAEPDPASPLPDWLSFDSSAMSFTFAGAQNLKQSAKVTLLVIPEGWCVKKPVTVSVSAKSTAPTMKFNPSSMTLNPGTGDVAFTIFTVTPASFASEEVTVSRIMESKTEYANNTVLNVSISGSLAIVTAPYVDGKAHTYKVYLNVAGKETAFTVKTLAASKAVDMTLKAGGTIDLAVEDSPVTITAAMKNYHTDEASFALSSICIAGTNTDVTDKFGVVRSGNVFTVTATGDPDPGSYTATVTAACANGSTVSKTVSFKVKRSSKVPAAGITLKAAGSIDVLRPGTEVTLTPTVKNNYTWTMAAGDITVTKTYDGATKTKVSLDVTGDFSISVRDGKYVITANAGVSHADKFNVQATVSGMTSKAVTLKVIQGKVKITQSVKAVTLLKTDRYSQGLVVLTLDDKSLAGIAKVELDARSEALFDLKDLGNGRYAIAYDSFLISTNKAQTVKLLVFMEGNRTASANATISVKVSFS